MKKSFIKFFDKIIVIILAITGLLISCDDDIKPMYGVQPEYGVPQSEYETKVLEDSVNNIKIIKSIKSEENQ